MPYTLIRLCTDKYGVAYYLRNVLLVSEQHACREVSVIHAQPCVSVLLPEGNISLPVLYRNLLGGT